MSGRLPRLPGVVATIDTAGEGGFWGFLVGYPHVAVVNQNLSGTPNAIKAAQFVLPFRVKVSKITWDVTTDESGKFIGAAIYDASATTVLIEGRVSTTSTGQKTAAITEVTLEPGVYWFAWTADGSTVEASHINISSIQSIYNENGVKQGSAANTSTAGVFPTTLGTITAAGQDPLAVFFEP